MYYTQTGLLFPYYHTFPQDIQVFEQEFPCIFRPTVPLESTVPEYEVVLQPEGDLFKAPETIIEDEEPLIGLDPAESSMISFGGEMIACQDLVHEQDIESSIDFGQLLSEVFYECKKDILGAKLETDEPAARSQVLEVDLTTNKKDENNVYYQEQIRKSASTGCITSMEKLPRTSEPRDLLDYQGMRRAFSEGDLEILGNGSSSSTRNTGSIKSSKSTSEQQVQMIMNSSSSEDRMEKLLRYRNKKAKRNFGRKIKYACRKALADNQPRIRGRFAKTGGN